MVFHLLGIVKANIEFEREQVDLFKDESSFSRLLVQLGPARARRVDEYDRRNEAKLEK